MIYEEMQQKSLSQSVPRRILMTLFRENKGQCPIVSDGRNTRRINSKVERIGLLIRFERIVSFILILTWDNTERAEIISQVGRQEEKNSIKRTRSTEYPSAEGEICYNRI